MYDLAQNNTELSESKIGTSYISQTPFQLIEQKMQRLHSIGSARRVFF